MLSPEFHRNIELDDAAQSQLLEPKKSLSKAALAILFGLVAVSLVAMPFLFQGSAIQERGSSNSDENLLPLARVQLTLPSPAPPVEEQSSSRIAEPAVDTAAVEQLARERAEFEEQKRIAAAEQAARDAENDQKKWERYRSPMVVSEAGQSEPIPGDPAKTPEEAAKSAATFQETNPNSQLLGALSAKAVEVSKAEQVKRIDALVPQGTMIRGVLETAVQTDLPGMVRAVTTEDVWSFDGRRVLVPSGTRLIGEYNAGLAQGQTRAFIVWTRLLRADGVSLNLGSPGTDELGVTGSGGDVDNHYFKRFGSAVLLTALSAAPQLLTEPSVSASRRRHSQPVITSTTDPVTNKTTQVITYPDDVDDRLRANLGQKGVQVLAEGFAQVAQEALKGTVNIQPTISINQGTPVAIFVKRDLDFSELYPDPVVEKFKELKRERSVAGETAWRASISKGGED